jgi:hypothetical protein
MIKYKASERRVDLYDIGDGLTLMNIILKNDEGKMQEVHSNIGYVGKKAAGCQPLEKTGSRQL